MSENTKIRMTTQGPLALIHIEGDVTAASEAAFAQAHRDFEACGSRGIVLEFDEKAYINSGGIALLLQFLAEVHRRRLQIGITGLTEHFMKISRLVGITRFAKVYPSLEEAMGNLLN